MKPKIKLIYVVPSLKKSGPTNQLYEIIRNLDFERFEAALVILSERIHFEIFSDLEKLPITIKVVPFNRLLSNIPKKFKIKKWLQNYQPDIIHTTGFLPDTVISDSNFSKLQCATVRCFINMDYVGNYGIFVGNYMKYLHRRVLKKIPLLVFPSRGVAEKYPSDLRGSYKVIHNGINMEVYYPCRTLEEKMDLRDQLGIARENKVFIVVGVLEEWKNPKIIIKAFHSLADIYNAVLIFLGDGRLLKECKKIADERVIFKGYCSQVPDYLRLADVYISASVTEGFPNSVLEAAACGARLILSDIPQHIEMFEEYQGEVSLFEVNNEKRLKEALERELKREDSSGKDEISEFIRKNYSGHIMSRQYQNLYQQMKDKKDARLCD